MRKHCAAEKAAADPERFSGDGSAPPRFRFGFPVISLFAFPWRVLGCGERSEPHLSMPSTRYGAKRVKIGQLLFCTQTNSAVEGSNFFVFVTSLS